MRLVAMSVVVALSVCVYAPKYVEAAVKEGDIKYEYETFTYDQICELTANFKELSEGAKEKTEGGAVVAGIVGAVSKTSPLVALFYAPTAYIIKKNLELEYEFFNNIKSKMKKNGYKRMKMQYTLEYRRSKVQGDVTFAWVAKSKTPFSYYTK